MKISLLNVRALRHAASVKLSYRGHSNRFITLPIFYVNGGIILLLMNIKNAD